MPMINMDFGDDDGVTYIEGTKKVFLVTSYSVTLNSIQHNFVVSGTPKDAFDAVAHKAKDEQTDYEPLSCASLFELLAELERKYPHEEHTD